MDGHDSEDSKQSTADMSAFVQNLLQQMQTRFQSMSDNIVTKNILFSDSSSYKQSSLHARVCIAQVMGNRINELERSIGDLRTEMGIEGSPSPAPQSKSDEDGGKQDEGSA
ncbi:putative Heat shock factor binding 1 [Rosa chinensis]|uniref:Putative Heat shock factor binding 1 n=1 Tax=Rosa chinensis TaxID=74649 RepID=A0A2P6PWP7_ROSCH|nr:putative Heat shock factor binding 1 [Rosa chinensis]